MHSKYSISENIAQKNFKILSVDRILKLHKIIKSNIPFTVFNCTFIAYINHNITFYNIYDIPKDLPISSADYLILDFNSNIDYCVSVTLKPTDVYVSATLSYDYQNTKEFVQDILNLTINNIEQLNNYQKTCKKKADIFASFLQKLSSVIIFIINIIKAFF